MPARTPPATSAASSPGASQCSPRRCSLSSRLPLRRPLLQPQRGQTQMLLLLLRQSSGSSCGPSAGARYVALAENLTFFVCVLSCTQGSAKQSPHTFRSGHRVRMGHVSVPYSKQAASLTCASRMPCLNGRCSPSRRQQGCHGRPAHSSGWLHREQCGRRRTRLSHQRPCESCTANAGSTSHQTAYSLRTAMLCAVCTACHVCSPVSAAQQIPTILSAVLQILGAARGAGLGAAARRIHCRCSAAGAGTHARGRRRRFSHRRNRRPRQLQWRRYSTGCS